MKLEKWNKLDKRLNLRDKNEKENKGTVDGILSESLFLSGMSDLNLHQIKEE